MLFSTSFTRPSFPAKVSVTMVGINHIKLPGMLKMTGSLQSLFEKLLKRVIWRSTFICYLLAKSLFDSYISRNVKGIAEMEQVEK